MIPTCIFTVKTCNIRKSRYPLPSKYTSQGHFSEETTVFSLLFSLPDIKAHLGGYLQCYVCLINSMESYKKEEPVIL